MLLLEALYRTIIYANVGEVINAYNSNVIINSPEILTIQEPMASTYCAPYNEAANTTISPITEQTTPITDHLTQESTTTEDSITMSTATFPQQPDEGTLTTEPGSSTNAIITTMVTGLVDDTEQHNLHTTVPGYVAIGVSTILFVLFVLFGVVIAITIFRVKLQPQWVNRLNTDSNNNEYPPMKDEYTLSEVHLVST